MGHKTCYFILDYDSCFFVVFTNETLKTGITTLQRIYKIHTFTLAVSTTRQNLKQH